MANSGNSPENTVNNINNQMNQTTSNFGAKCMKNKDIIDKKLYLMKEEKRFQIEKANSILLNKMSKIMTKKPYFVKDYPIQTHPYTLNRTTRIKQINKIDSENKQMLYRIRNQKSAYAAQRYQKDSVNQVRLLQNISKYPVNNLLQKPQQQNVYNNNIRLMSAQQAQNLNSQNSDQFNLEDKEFGSQEYFNRQSSEQELIKLKFELNELNQSYDLNNFSNNNSHNTNKYNYKIQHLNKLSRQRGYYSQHPSVSSSINTKQHLYQHQNNISNQHFEEKPQQFQKATEIDGKNYNVRFFISKQMSNLLVIDLENNKQHKLNLDYKQSMKIFNYYQKDFDLLVSQIQIDDDQVILKVPESSLASNVNQQGKGSSINNQYQPQSLNPDNHTNNIQVQEQNYIMPNSFRNPYEEIFKIPEDLKKPIKKSILIGTQQIPQNNILSTANQQKIYEGSSRSKQNNPDSGTNRKSQQPQQIKHIKVNELVKTNPQSGASDTKVQNQISVKIDQKSQKEPYSISSPKVNHRVQNQTDKNDRNEDNQKQQLEITSKKQSKPVEEQTNQKKSDIYDLTKNVKPDSEGEDDEYQQYNDDYDDQAQENNDYEYGSDIDEVQQQESELFQNQKQNKNSTNNQPQIDTNNNNQTKNANKDDQNKHKIQDKHQPSLENNSTVKNNQTIAEKKAQENQQAQTLKNIPLNSINNKNQSHFDKCPSPYSNKQKPQTKNSKQNSNKKQESAQQKQITNNSITNNASELNKTPETQAQKLPQSNLKEKKQTNNNNNNKAQEKSPYKQNKNIDIQSKDSKKQHDQISDTKNSQIYQISEQQQQQQQQFDDQFEDDYNDDIEEEQQQQQNEIQRNQKQVEQLQNSKLKQSIPEDNLDNQEYQQEEFDDIYKEDEEEIELNDSVQNQNQESHIMRQTENESNMKTSNYSKLQNNQYIDQENISEYEIRDRR